MRKGEVGAFKLRGVVVCVMLLMPWAVAMESCGMCIIKAFRRFVRSLMSRAISSPSLLICSWRF